MKVVEVAGEWDPRPDAELSAQEREGRWTRNASLAWRSPRWSVGQREVPSIRHPHDVLVRVRAVGICGSDAHLFETDADGYVLLPYRVRLPLVPGHELAGEVAEVGAAVRSVRPGDPVAVHTLQYCGVCSACRAGLPSHCTDAEDQGFSIDGGMAEYVLSRESNVVPLAGLRERFSESDIYEIGALCEPASVAYLGMFARAGGVQPGATVAVHGCGAIGLAAIALARAAGAASVLAFATNPARAELALRLGADEAFDVRALSEAGTAAGEVTLERTGGNGVDMAIEAAGAAGAVLPQIERSLAVGGKVVLLGSQGGSVPLQTMAYMVKGASIYGSIGNIGGVEPVVALHSAGRIDLRPIITDRFPLDRAVEAVNRATEKSAAKVMIHVP
ncbi:scyllo-inosose 3-dehydrogenase [Microbacterium timonense]|uniref:scyllo-inosose 3-dehydrogenase n=1 Tax=Microbacterium timonense TaxID=2086576 RepID=UPI0013582357|nr:scyllo-inosose 3-dehydrogenase [Microbacterium timonense]